VAETACTTGEELDDGVLAGVPATAAGVTVVAEGGVVPAGGEDAAGGVLMSEMGDEIFLTLVDEGLVAAALLDWPLDDVALEAVSPDDAVVLAACLTLVWWVTDPDDKVCVVLDSSVDVVPLLDGESGCEDFAGPSEVEPPALPLADDEPPEPALSAWAIPAPLARAAPTPRVIAPAPSHVYGSM
jgi:hypothetical protein